MAQKRSTPTARLQKPATDAERVLRNWIGGQLRQPACRVPAPVWKRLTEDGHTEDVLTRVDSATSRAALLKVARSYLRDFRGDSHRKRVRARRRSDRPAVQRAAISNVIDLTDCLSRKEVKRGLVLSREMIRVAERQTYNGPESWSTPGCPIVSNFRTRVLGGRTLSEDESETLTGSIGAAMFELEFFIANEIPVLDHTSELSSGFDWDSADAREGLTARSEVTFRWGGKTLVAPLGERVLRVSRGDGTLSPIWRGEEVAFQIMGDSVLGWLNGIALILATVCPWTTHDAVWFVLLGERPPTFPVFYNVLPYTRGSEHSLMRIEITVHPWVSADSLLEFYRRIQRILVGARNRAPEIESLELFDFVSRERHEGRSFRESLEAWLAAHPSQRRRFPARDKGSLKRFTNQFRDIERQVLRPFGTAREIEPLP